MRKLEWLANLDNVMYWLTICKLNKHFGRKFVLYILKIHIIFEPVILLEINFSK